MTIDLEFTPGNRLIGLEKAFLIEWAWSQDLAIRFGSCRWRRAAAGPFRSMIVLMVVDALERRRLFP